MARPTVWIPASTPAEMRGLLPSDTDLHEYPAHGSLPSGPHHADMLIAAFDAQRAVEVIPQLHDLRVVQTLSAGVDTLVDHIPRGVTFCDGAGIHDSSVSEWAVMATLTMRRRLLDHLEAQHEHTWTHSSGGADLGGAQVLIVGYGSIGRTLEARLLPFGATVTRVARRAREGVESMEALPRLLPDADVVVILLPLTPHTQRMVDKRFLEQMREGALLVNAARGPIVDTGALLDALHRGHITAALDVTDPEPLPDGHPLWSAPGVLITPHIAGAVEQLMGRAWKFAGDQVRRYAAGEALLNVVSEGY